MTVPWVNQYGGQFGGQYGSQYGSGLYTSAAQPLSQVMPLPPGLSGGSGFLPGMSALTGDPAVALEVAAKQARATTNSMVSASMLSGTIEKNFNQIRLDVEQIGTTLRSAAEHLSDATGGSLPVGRRPIAGERRHQQPRAGAPGPTRQQPPPKAGIPTTRHAPADEPEGKAPPEGKRKAPKSLGELGFAGSRDAFSLSDVRERAGNFAARHLQSAVGQYELRDHHWYEASTGRALGPLASRAVGMGTRGIEGAGKVAGGAGLTEAFPGLGRVAGPVGFAVGAAAAGAHILESQRAQNLPYQQITGGPNFSLTDPQSGFRQRLSENAFGWSNIGGMGAGQARELFRGVSEQGVSSDTRQEALDFATAQFRRTGMGVQQSLNLISKSIQNGVDHFGSLNDALDKVSDTARKAGANVNTAQLAFSQTLGAVQSQVTGTAAAPTIAAAMQSELTRQGHTLAGQLDFTGMLTQPSLMMQASALGQNPATYMAGVQESPALMGKGLQAQVDRIRDAVFSPQALQWAHDQAATAVKATGGQLTPAVAATIGRAMAAKGLLNPMQFSQVAAQLGLAGVTPANVYEVAAKVALGGFRFDQALPASAGNLPDAGKTIGGKPIVTADKVPKYGTSDPGNLAGTQNRQYGELAEAIGQPTDPNLGTGPDTAGASYIESVTGAGGTGQRSGILEKLLKEEGSYSKQHFVVQGPKGPVSVSFEQAFSQYQDQLRRGDVTIQETGETVAQATGNLGVAGTQVTSAGKDTPAGAKAPEQVAGTVTIYATDELKRILGFRQGAFIGDAQRNGVPAAAFPGSPDEYPTAGGG